VKAGMKIGSGALLVVVALLIAVASASAANPWANESVMVNAVLNRDTFVYDPGIGHYIDRQALLQAPLAAYYDAHGFDANFRTWAQVQSIPVGAAANWSGCVNAAHPEPCPDGSFRFDPVVDGVASGTITVIGDAGAYIALACGNFTQGRAAGPMPTISGVKYEDLNANGQRDAGEPGLSGWTMRLLYNGNEVASTTTGAGGGYSFQLNADSLPIGAGTYQVVEDQQNGWHASQAPGAVSVPLGAEDHTYGGNDFGNYRNATISGSKFDDSDVDGLWDGAEPGLADWTIQLSNGGEQATGGDGSYAFSVRPGTYAVNELLKSGWRQTSPGGDGTRTYTVVSGQVVDGADFGNVCLGGVAVGPVNDSTGLPLSGVEVRIEEVSVPGILTNDPALPRSTTGTPTFGGLLPGTYRVTAFLPDGVFTTDPDAVVVGGRFAIVKQVTVNECGTARVPLHFFTASTAGKVTGGMVKLLVPGGFATSGFEFMGRPSGARGTLEFQDHATGANLHTSTIEAVYVSGNVAWVWGRVDVDGTSQRFRLRLVDAGEPGTSDRYELTLANGYVAGFDGPLNGGNVQIHA
jgi:hypothetical protein